MSLFKLIIQYLWVQKAQQCWTCQRRPLSSFSQDSIKEREREREREIERPEQDSDVILKHWNISAGETVSQYKSPSKSYDPTILHFSSYGWNSLSQYESVSSENAIIWMLGIEKSPFPSSHLRKWVYQYVINYLFANKLGLHDYDKNDNCRLFPWDCNCDY